jgi:hypothetical protein
LSKIVKYCKSCIKSKRCHSASGYCVTITMDGGESSKAKPEAELKLVDPCIDCDGIKDCSGDKECTTRNQYLADQLVFNKVMVIKDAEIAQLKADKRQMIEEMKHLSDKAWFQRWKAKWEAK